MDDSEFLTLSAFSITIYWLVSLINWLACYRLGKAHHYGRGIEKDIAQAKELITKAKALHDLRGDNAACADIKKEEILSEWLLINQEAGTFE